MSKITQSANQRECTIRLVGICNHDASTVVFCHFRLMNVTGFGYKELDIGAYGCSACHAVVDTDKSPEVQLAFAHGVVRTTAHLMKTGLLVAA